MRVAAIIYGEASGIVRRIVVSDSLAELAAPTVLGNGEAAIILDPGEVLTKGSPDLAACYALVEAQRGKPSESDRCIVVNDKGDIEAVILADPAIDAVKATETLVQNIEATPDWKFSPTTGEFEKPVEVVVEPPAPANTTGV